MRLSHALCPGQAATMLWPRRENGRRGTAQKITAASASPPTPPSRRSRCRGGALAPPVRYSCRSPYKTQRRMRRIGLDWQTTPGPHSPRRAATPRDQARRLKCLAGFAGHFGCGQPAQFLIDQRQDLGSGLGIAVMNGVEETGDVAHGAVLPATISNGERRLLIGQG